VITYREQIIQIARLSGNPAFQQRFGTPQTADPDDKAIAAFIAEELETTSSSGLVSEAAASDDVTDQESAASYLDDRLRELADIIPEPSRDRIRKSFLLQTSEW
jgi:hypothetical protein